ncbi:MAG TPA: sigma-E factor negative regulatory protein [Steroidobacteraceae bacterium]|nr:sigma-E factor negative regulatory protein [Steroidobacteraceae bacterium]
MNSDELDSQLSAMFDDELPAPECELLARRLARDDTLKARWGRYAAIGAAIRMERGIRLDSPLLERVSATLASEPALLVASARGRTGGLVHPSWFRWWQPVAGAAVAAGVAAGAILWLRNGSPDAPIVAQSAVITAPAVGLTAASSSGGSDSYVVPPSLDTPVSAPPTELADFVVAHSEFSMPLLRRSALAALVTSESVSDSTDARHSGRGSDASRSSHAASAP